MAQIIRFAELRARARARRRAAPWNAPTTPVRRLDTGWLVAAAFFLSLSVGWLVFSGTAERLLRSEVAGEVVARLTAPRFSLCMHGGGNCVVDGDTFDYAGQRIRIADIDTPEVFSPRCAYEKRLGEAATRRLQELLNAGPFELERIDRDEDVYGRKLRVVTRDGRSLGAVLVAERLAHAWDGRKHPWC